MLQKLRLLFRRRGGIDASTPPRSSSSLMFDQTDGLTSFDGPAKEAPEPPVSDAERLHRGWAIDNELHRNDP